MVSSAAFASVLASLAFFWSMIKSKDLWMNKISAYFSPYVHIAISEYGAERFQRSELFDAVEAYLSEDCAVRARKLKAEIGRGRKNIQISVDDSQEVSDTFRNVPLWWRTVKEKPSYNVISYHPGDEDRRFYKVVFHRSHRNMVVHKYLPHVLEAGREATAWNRQRRLFTNNPSHRWNSSGAIWSPVAFHHPATFDTLAMDPTDKETIKGELMAFKDRKEYYSKVGKAWKRGYLLFGPPGTGKSTMIAAMANYLEYDVYDLELTAVKNNTELRKLFIETTGKSIIVIEDIDCSVDLTGKRKDKKKAREKFNDNTKLPIEPNKDDDDDDTKLTLSGMLNFIDGLWSACGGERIIIFTTNNKDKLDPALIRPGRMDKHIEMSYCRYEAFKVLANNYLDITEHEFFELFGEIQQLLEEIDISPADVAEKLMPISTKKDAGACLEGLVVALKIAKQDAAVKVKEAANKSTEKEEALTPSEQRRIGEEEQKDDNAKDEASY
ncbi:hypothetical protein E2562_036170 [Oryza meyeriana var. granulata]|uniref:AAA+ ATPase domain-containing protein n=1 Tax=Oryza meyeriana var. granulata TaxID=110450 RepID=A0A6G1CVS4_9ORYZ|nr:hypothetical protein E2562_036170 [Oryza meyeriana var. granulata]